MKKDIARKSDSFKEYEREKKQLSLFIERANVNSFFNEVHPLIAFLFFVFVTIITMFSMNPIIIVISFFSSLMTTALLVGLHKMLKSLLFSLPLLALMFVINPLFVHKGETVLFFLFDNQITLEAIIYGVFASLMLFTVFYWMKCFSIVMTSDKFVYLFSRFLPQLAVVLSMSIAFLPKLIKQYKKTMNAQKALGMFSSNKISDKILFRFRIIDSLIGWSLESAIETSSSMLARGYGLKGRKSFALFQFRRIDFFFLLQLLLFFALSFSTLCLIDGAMFYPTLNIINLSTMGIVCYCSFAILALFGIFMEIKEKIKWRYFISKI